GARREGEERDGDRRQPGADAHQSSSLRLSWPAAWDTCPAIASALRCASEPSVSASSAVNFLPPSSSAGSRPANWCSFSRSVLVCCACWALTVSTLGWMLE